MQRWLLALVALLLLIGPAAQAGDHEGARRFAFSVGFGSFDERDSDVMLRKDGEPGNPIIGWATSEQVAAAFAFDVRPGLTVDLSYARLDYDFGADLGLMWKLSGDLFAVNTAPNSAYSGTTVAHEGIDFLIDLAYHF
jgi:hypothetical protein